VSRVRKKTFYLQFCMGTHESHQKGIFNTSKVKIKTKIQMGSIQQSLQDQPKTIKKLSKQINQSKQKKSQINSTSKVKTKFAGSTQNLKKNKKIPKRSMLSTLAKNLYGGYLTEFTDSTQNLKKKVQNIKSTNQNKHFPEQSKFSTLKVKRSKKFLWGLPDGIRPGA
jgi:hypothetical protein